MFIRYNDTAKYYEYDTSLAQNGSGPWIILPLSAAQIIGTLPPAQLPANIAYTNVGNTFTAGQNILSNLRVRDGVYERLRGTPQGYWQNVPFDTANFTAGGGGTWTIGSAAVIQNRFTLIGLTMIWQMYISWFSGGNVVNGTVNGLFIKIPGGFTAQPNVILTTAYGIDGGIGRVDLDAGPSGINMGFNKRDSSNFTPGAATGIIGTFTFEVAGASANIDV